MKKRMKTPRRPGAKKKASLHTGRANPAPSAPPPMPAKRVLLARQSDGLSPRNLDEAMALAQRLSDSSLVPKDYRGKPGDILIAIGLGHEVGLKWAQALQSIAVIGGRPTIWGDAGLGLVMSHPDYEWHKEHDDPVEQTATCTIKRRGLDPVTRSFGQADAERIIVWERDSQGTPRQVRLADRPVWKAGYGVRMRQMRARWWAMKDTFPDALKGIEGREWVEDDGVIIREPRDDAPALRAEDVMPRRREEKSEPSVEATQQSASGRGITSGAEREARENLPSGRASAQDSRQRQPAEGTRQESQMGEKPMRTAPEKESGPDHSQSAHEALAPSPASVGGQSALPLAPPGGMVVEINGRSLATGGITKATLLKAYKLGAQLDELTQKGAAKDLLGREWGLTHRHELTEESGLKYVAALAKLVNAALARR